MNQVKELLFQIAKRAERKSDEYLVKSFVPLGHISTFLKTEENQVIQGRRGTGKTHFLKYLKNEVQKKGDIVVEVDMRTMGSTGGIYSDASISFSERATRLLSDTLCAIRESILEQTVVTHCSDLSKIVPLLDSFAELSTNIVIDGDVAIENSKGVSNESSDMHKAVIGNMSKFSIEGAKTNKAASNEASKMSSAGREKLKLHFSSITRTLDNIVKLLPNKKLWLLIDEWSEIPLDLQHYLADSLKRMVFSVSEVTVKIASIAHRSRFRSYENGALIGLELSSDASSSINLDEFMVFDNDKERALAFYRNLIHKHCLALDENDVTPHDSRKFLTSIFTLSSAFEEFVRAAEGVPRDAIHIISNAAVHSTSSKLSIIDIRQSARKWYTTNKSGDINSRVRAVQLLDWIIVRVIAEKKARGFLVRSDVKDELLEFLYDSRIVHLVKQGVTAKNHKGKRFNLYVLDYGCYADLLSTNDAPKGMLFEEGKYIEIPLIDYRTVKNSILDLDHFNKNGELPLVNSTDDIYLQTKHNGTIMNKE
ncbi:ORC-CDC6 family AAA ATPase, partial [Candidatus Enterovibrio escicola]|uniref:ORC-CDC6 family AAA ATPase n=1 Tax=Candidatus Enterovibrio escicola TaxID=1927127 RepID=UPI001237EF91